MRKSDIIFGSIHLIGCLSITIGAIIYLIPVLTTIYGPTPIIENNPTSSFYYFGMVLGLVIAIALIIITGIYTIMNMIFFIKWIKGKKIFFILVIDMIVGLIFLLSSFDFINPIKSDKDMVVYLFLMVIGIVGSISGIIYSLLVLKLNKQNLSQYLR